MSSGAAHLPVSDGTAARRAALRLMRREPGAFARILALNALATAVGLSGPWLLGLIIDDVANHGDPHEIDRLALLLLLAAVLQIGLTRYARYLAARFGERLSAHVREQFVDRVLGLEPAVVEQVPTGDLAARGSGDVDSVAAALRDAAPDMLIAVLQATFVILATFLVDPLLGACGVVGLLGIVVVTRWYLRRARAAYLELGAANSHLAEILLGTVQGARTIEAFGLQKRRLEVNAAAVDHAIRGRLRALALRSVLYPIVDISAVLPFVGVLLVGGALYDHGMTSLGAVVTSALYLRQLDGPLETLELWIDSLQGSAASFARLEGLAELPRGRATSTAVPADDRIVVAGVHFAYEPGRDDVLCGVDLEIRPGERLAIVGPSGAGKSTLGRLLAGIDRPRTGTLTVGGVPLADLPTDLLRRHIILVTQEHHVFQTSVRDNLLIAKPHATDDELNAALHAVGASARLDLDTVLSRSGHWPDSTQAQQLALARVVLADPHTVILDEATATLDPTTARETERSLSAALKGRTVLAIAHRLHTAYDADRVAVMEDGRLTESGAHSDLVARGGTYARLWRSWQA